MGKINKGKQYGNISYFPASDFDYDQISDLRYEILFEEFCDSEYKYVVSNPTGSFVNPH